MTRALPAPPGLDEPLGVAEGVKIRAADAARQGADEHLARPRLGRGDVGDHELPVPHDDGAHDEPPSRPRGRGGLARGHGDEVGWDRVVHEPHAPDGALLGIVDIALVVGATVTWRLTASSSSDVGLVTAWMSAGPST